MLNEKLDEYLKKDYYPFHMPGAKRNSILRNDLPYKRDLTEIDGFDNLNDPKEILHDLEVNLANIYNVNETVISTNGSTCGILASIRSLTYKNKKILIQRTCHKAVYNAIEVFNLDVDYIDIVTNEINAVIDIDYVNLEKSLKNDQYAAVLITSPSYEGYILDLDKIYKICKKNNTPLLVDLAHGSHFILEDFYSTAFDIAITSFHKNLSGLTPSAGVLINNKSLAKEVRRNMAIFQTSSPSYVIMQSIDEMIENFDKFSFFYKDLNKNLNDLYSLKLKNLKLIDNIAKDRTKILISTKNTNINGKILQDLLRKEKIEIEMAYPNYCLLISTIFDSKRGFDRLKEALINIDKSIYKTKNEIKFSYTIPKQVFKISEAMLMDNKTISLSNSLDEISACFVYAYPPGIPLLTPGELIDNELIDNINQLKSSNVSLNIDKYISVID
jgi:glycine hydroxymethyltransferase